MWESRKEWCVWIFVFSHPSFCNRPGKWRVVWTWRNSGRRLQLRCSHTSALQFFFSLLELRQNAISLQQLHVLSVLASSQCYSFAWNLCFWCLLRVLFVAFFGTKFPHILLQWYSLKKKEQLRLFVWFWLFGICFTLPVTVHHTHSRSSV